MKYIEWICECGTRNKEFFPLPAIAECENCGRAYDDFEDFQNFEIEDTE